ncbi:MAG: S10 family peptidase [Acidobacteria bacterium]|jgi:hypothetical protein|nr:S10 family peptidase [Acidobacteriota bacterium]
MKRLARLLDIFVLAAALLVTLHWSTEEAWALQNEAGFIAMEPVSFYFHYGSRASWMELRSSEARLWYSFHAADRDSTARPLFVFFNGGPGSASSSGLMSMYTSRYTLDNRIESGGGDQYIPNPRSWTRLGNLLYIDARQTGFSYSLLANVADWDIRFREFNAQNFNSFLDGADFVRLLLRFLARHPELRSNPVVIVGESYGGARATVMLHLLLNYASYGDGTEMYQDPALATEIQAHLEAVFPEYQGQIVPPEVVARQFGHQILVQPTLSMGYQWEVTERLWSQPESVLYQIGREVGIPYDPRRYPDPFVFIEEAAGRDPYIYTRPAGWLNSFFANAGRLLRFTSQLSLVTGTDVTRIPELYASNRLSAYRLYDPDYDSEGRTAAGGDSLDELLFLRLSRLEEWLALVEPGDVESVFGPLQPWDRYFLGLNQEANWAFHFFNVAWVRGYEVNYRVPRFGRMFLKNVAHVRTFVTNAALDLVVYSEAIPPALARHTEILAGVRYEREQPAGAERTGQIVLEYRPDAYANLPAIGTRTIRFPVYATSCHAVSLTQPDDFNRDVVAWLAEAGLPDW